MKKALIVFGGIFVVITLLVTGTIGLSIYSKGKWEAVAIREAESKVRSLDKLSREQFDAYWGVGNPLPEENRVKIVDWASQFGSLVSITDTALHKHTSTVSFTGKGIRHTFMYDVNANFTNGALVFRFTFGVRDNLMYTDNMQIIPDKK